MPDFMPAIGVIPVSSLLSAPAISFEKFNTHFAFFPLPPHKLPVFSGI
ncbi:MAG: hypothetical protein V2B19_19820 [Pseudomonadota bacterium]